MKKVLMIICILLLIVGCGQKQEEPSVVDSHPEKIVLDSSYGKVYVLDQGNVVESENVLSEEEIATLQKRITVINFAFYHLSDDDYKVESYEHIELKSEDQSTLVVLCAPYLKYGDKLYKLGYDHEIFTYTDKMIKERH